MEAPFYLYPLHPFISKKAEQVIVGTKSVYKIINADEKEALTTLVMISDSVVMVFPMIMYAYKRIPAIVTQSIPKG